MNSRSAQDDASRSVCEIGAQVLEVNPGSDRTGALVTKAIGEATQSCRLARVRCMSAALFSK